MFDDNLETDGEKQPHWSEKNKTFFLLIDIFKARSFMKLNRAKIHL